jgi:SAM-dependent methyltransferase
VRRRQPVVPNVDPAPQADDALQAAVAALYRGEGRIQAAYLTAKLRVDPVHLAAQALVPLDGRVVDLGCGAGQLSLLLALGGPRREVVGLDPRWAAVERARRAAARARFVSPPRFLISDARVAPIPRCRAALLVDVLHGLPIAEQDALVRRAARALEPGGALLVREVDRAIRPRWRYALVALEERLATLTGWSGGGGPWFRPIDELAAIARAEGLETHVRPMWGKTPYANVLLVARRQGP